MWPQGTTIETAPVDFIVAFNQAVKINSWFENLASDEIPPHWMWELDWELDLHFKRVKEERDKKYGTGDDSSSDAESNLQDAGNQYAARFRD